MIILSKNDHNTVRIVEYFGGFVPNVTLFSVKNS